MSAIQLEFNLQDGTIVDTRIERMQHQIDAMHASMDKVRKKLFSQMTEVQNTCIVLQAENQQLKKILKELQNDTTPWVYAQDCELFSSS